MSEQSLELEAFSKLIIALEPWLGEAVLIGGWARRLYRLDPRARKLGYPPLTTLDGDIAVPPRLKEQESTVRQRLLETGFTEEFEGEDHPRRTITMGRAAVSTRNFLLLWSAAKMTGMESEKRQ